MSHELITLKCAGYLLLLKGFTEWLQVLGYSPLSVPGTTNTVKHFLHWLEVNHKTEVLQINPSDGSAYLVALQSRMGYRTNRPISGSYLNKSIQGLQLLSRYLRETGKSDVGFRMEHVRRERNNPSWLTKSEVIKLYECTADNVLGLRDRTMLVIYYDCGLRLNEGAQVELKDIDLNRGLLHVRKGKRSKERYVPLAEQSKRILQCYLEQGRPELLQQIKTERLFLDTGKGRPIGKQSLYIRIKQLAKRSGVKKRIGTHTLRHSIATHLLMSGMKLERIKEFLGHTSLDSTQLYTHLKHELKNKLL